MLIDTDVIDFENRGEGPLKIFIGENTAVATPENVVIVLPGNTIRLLVADLMLEENTSNMLIISNETGLEGKYRVVKE